MTDEQLAEIKHALSLGGWTVGDGTLKPISYREMGEKLLAALEAAQAEAEKWRVHADQTLTAYQFLRNQNTTLSNELQQALDRRNTAESEAEFAQAEADSETRWAKHYHDEAEQLRADYESVRKDFEVVSDRRQIYMELAERRGAENTRLREALSAYANHGNWEERCTRYMETDDSMVRDIWQGGEDINGWETAERALATNENQREVP